MLFRSLLRQPRLGTMGNGLSSQYPLQSLLVGYQCSYNDDHISYGEMGVPVPPFGCTFSTAPNLEHILAVANEEGFVRLYNTESRSCKKKFFQEWMAHWNAIFDLAWIPGEHRLVTASGDQTAKIWDVEAGELIGVCKGHQCSLKSISFSKFEKAVFCSGGRDGNIMVWDTRCTKKDGFYRQVNQISGAHNTLDKSTPLKSKKKQISRGLAPSVDFQQSVTVVLFQDEHTLVSAGAVDGVVKVWDLRKNYTSFRQEPMACKSFPYPGSSTRKLGYSSLILDSTGSTLFANCTDDNIYMFNMTGLKTSPVAVFNGHQNSTFYVKSNISPDDQFLISGSSDESAYIWKISEPWCPPTLLLGHSQEVTSVCWCPTDFTKIATCSDDNTMKVWRLKRGLEEKPALDKHTLVGWAYQKKTEERAGLAMRSNQMTPAKAPRVKSSPLVSSPWSAACAPNCAGDLPLPSNTPTSSVKTPPAKAQTQTSEKDSLFSISPKPPSSSKILFQNWVNKTPSSSPSNIPPVPEILIPSPRKALIPVSQTLSQAMSNPETAALSRNKAKRRLDSSCLEKTEQKCFKSCSCVTELEGKAKKSHLDLCCLSGNQDTSGKDLLGLCKLNEVEKANETAPTPSSPANAGVPAGFGSPPLSFKPCGGGPEVVDKENSSPERKNWLLAMGARWRTEKGGIRSPSSASSQHKRQDGKASPVATTPGSMRKICTYFHRKSQEEYRSPEQSKEL